MSELPTTSYQADVAIIGGSFAAVAAAQAATARGLRVVLTERHPWIGGQVTSQALCVLDEFHDPIGEGIGYSRRYGQFRNDLRELYRRNYKLSAYGAAQLHFNAGTCYDSPVVAEPSIAHELIRRRLQPAVDEGRLHVLTGFAPLSAQRDGDRVTAVTCASLEGPKRTVRIEAEFFLGGDEVGELYPLLGIGYRMGTEAQQEFGEPHAPPQADPRSVQSFTWCFAVEYVPGGDFTIAKPDDYDDWKQRQGAFHLESPGATHEDPALMFRVKLGRGGYPIRPAFYYRSMIDARNFDDPRMPCSRTVINVSCNDYHHESFLDHSDPQAVQERAKALSRAYLYWLQTEAPRDEGGQGYPELRLVPQITGTADGFAMAPYIREGRRLKACQTVVEQDISSATQPHARAKLFDNSVGLGCFLLDIHRRVGAGSISQMTRPYQVPLGALVSPELRNFAVAGKGIGVTQITNGAYRLHNLEWAIGEAAGELAAWCVEHNPAHPSLQGRELLEFQRRLAQAGVPLFWYEDIPNDHPAFEAIQVLSVRGLWPAHPTHLRFDPQYSTSRAQGVFEYVLAQLAKAGLDVSDFRERHLLAHHTRMMDFCHRVLTLLDRQGWPASLLGGSVPPPGDAEARKLFDDLIPEPADDRPVLGRRAEIR